MMSEKYMISSYQIAWLKGLQHIEPFLETLHKALDALEKYMKAMRDEGIPADLSDAILSLTRSRAFTTLDAIRKIG